MKGYDAFAGVVKSGGKTRRAAKMVILDVDHPDILDFIDSKMLEEKKAWALIEMGYDPSFTGEAYGSVFFQNANHSVRVTDDVHAGRRRRQGLDDPRGRRRQADGHLQGGATSSAGWPTPPTCAATRASSTTRRSTTGTRARTRTGSTRATRAPSTCSSTTRPASRRRPGSARRTACAPSRSSTAPRSAARPSRSPRTCCGETDHRRMAAHRAALVTLVGDRKVYRMTPARRPLDPGDRRPSVPDRQRRLEAGRRADARGRPGRRSASRATPSASTRPSRTSAAGRCSAG